MNAKINVVKCLDCNSSLWTNNKAYNECMVKSQLEYCYAKFRSSGYLFLNEVYYDLGIPLTKQGQVSGWIFKPEYMKNTMWTVWTKDDEYADVYITFECLGDILDVLPEE